MGSLGFAMVGAFVVGAVIVSAIAAWTDFRTGFIPNWLTVGTVVLAIVLHFGVGLSYGGFRYGLEEAGFSIAGAVFCSIGPGAMYMAGGMGGGDLKLFAAIGALLQPLLGIEAEAYGLLAGAIIALANMAYRGTLLRTIGSSFSLLLNPLRARENRREIPQEALTWFRLGPSIFIGTVATLMIHGYALLAS
jgi:prepilin peptidase CpaA